jgi:hypothetical protein
MSTHPWQVPELSKDLVIDCFEAAVTACGVQEYSREEELQWYLAYLLGKATGMRIKREVRTETTYYTDERGLLEVASNRVKGRKRSGGFIDIVCDGDSEKWAIEIKYPSGKGQEVYYGKGLRRDAQKLRDLKGCTRRYMLALVKMEHEGAFSKELDLCRREGWIEDFILAVRYF